ncbi:MAG: hypothetical protein M3421_12475, partial [Bacteroidota bacterium]|nr:hypothetical protein [Bacteroidota bacterium]
PLSTASNVLPPGTYTVTIFNNVTQCSFETSYIIGNNPPVVSLNLVQNDQTTCNPNGTISILEILENNQPVALSGYNYILYDDSYSLLAESADKLNFDSNFTFEDLPAGNYIVQAIHKTTGCSIPSATTIIDDAILYPVLTLVSLPNPDESCPGGNSTGAIAALADGFDDNNLDYVFNWYDSNNNLIGMGSSIPAPNNLVLSVGYYTLVVENSTTGCSVSGEYYVPFHDTEIKVFASQIVNSSHCDPDFNGSVIFIVEKDEIIEADLSEYSFELTYPDGTKSIVNNSPTGLAPGAYYVSVTHNSLSCVSDMTPFEIQDISLNTEIVVVQSEPDMSCDQDNPTGVLTVTKIDGIDVNGGTDLSNYEFEWSFNGTLLAGKTSYFITDQPTGPYKVAIKNITTGCIGKAELFISSQPAYIEIIPAIPVHSTRCDKPYDGMAAINEIHLNGVLETDLSNYTITWRDENSNPIADTDNLAPGTYYVSAYHNILHCSSNILEVIIEDKSINPVVIVEQTDFDIRCDDSKNPTGRLNIVTIDAENTDFSNYSINWYSNADLTTSIGTNRFIEDQPAGWYTVVVVNNGVGGSACTGSAEFYLAPQPSVIAITNVNRTHVIRCTATFDGLATVSEVYRNGILENDLNAYSFEWFDEQYTTIGTGVSRLNLAPGTYYVNATHNDIGCTSNYFRVIIEDHSTLPIIVIAPSAPNISCNPLLPTGSLSASIPGVTDYSDYTFNWFNINDSNSALAPDPSDPKRIINKPAGTYTVEVTYNLTGCTSSFSGFIEDNVQLGKPVFGLTPIHNADCKDSGEINIVGVTGSELDNYTFRWYKVPYNPANPFHSGTELSRTGLSLGTYYVEAEDITYGCTTIIQTELIDESTAPEIQFDFDAAVQAQCLPGILTGQVIANVDGIYGASLNSLFDFTWYYGSSTTVESNRMIGEKDYFISQLDSGYYSVIIKN